MMSNPADVGLEYGDVGRTKTACPRCGGFRWVAEPDGLYASDPLLLRCLGADYTCRATRPVPKVRPTRR